MKAFWTMLSRMASAGGTLYFFPALFGFEDEVRGFLRRHMTLVVPILCLVFFAGCIALHAEQENQRRDFNKRLEGASFRRR
ncbi:hypothetical protein [Maricaulis sp.]|uniref:hypothetical protein n=1 Tax=Maricaulis sp. TaxID=1486257 RepID=UPI000C473242|nr:hypothetical protein [Maricaulis sp.]MAC89640.1 hypothetical protein [Maricaulis sp.]